MKKRTNTAAMVECALMIAVGTVLAQIKIFQMPYGGSVTLVSSLPFIIVSYRHGLKWGLIAGFTNGFAQMMAGFWRPPAGTIGAIFACIMLDYLLAFACLGTACIFRKPFKNKFTGVAVSVSAVMVMRFMCSFLSGAVLWGSYQSSYRWADGLSVWAYSFIYNASYMMPEMLITVIVSCVLVSVAPQLFDNN
ncbi:MAG: energy-coupled thiamine transporter ThiT [Oscillospiraceae bacterium]|nr:energy-coupled thiamine transporter ThiT [Oscillospiraceae bacterium]